MSAQIFSFTEARAAKLRKAESKLGGVFRQLENADDMKGVSTEQIIEWAVRINNAGAETIHEVVADMERVIRGQNNAR